MQAQIEAAERKVQHLKTPQRTSQHGGTLSGSMQTSAQELEGSFLTMSKSNTSNIMNQYMNQMQEIAAQEARDNANCLSPIPETDS